MRLNTTIETGGGSTTRKISSDVDTKGLSKAYRWLLVLSIVSIFAIGSVVLGVIRLF